MSLPDLFLIPFIAGLLLAVRLMFFGAERRRLRSGDLLPLRRSEPAAVVFLVAFGITGYVSENGGRLPVLTGLAFAGTTGLIAASVAMRLAVAMARIRPEQDPDDRRYVHQGRVGVVTRAIPSGGEGEITFQTSHCVVDVVRARDIDRGAIAAGEEICIERIEDGVAHVERWTAVEHRL